MGLESKGDYSLDKFRSAQKEGKKELDPAEQELLGQYRQLRQKMGFEVLGMAAPPLAIGHMLVNMLSKNRRQVMFGATEKLEKKHLETEAGQLEAAHEEAEGLNAEYDEKARAIEDAVNDFEGFVKRLNEKQ